MTITGKCAHCGAQVVFGDNDEAIICEYCASVNAIQEVAAANIARNRQISPVGNAGDNTVNNTDTKSVQPTITLREVIPDYKWRATYRRSSDYVQEGFLYLTKQEVGYAPNKYFAWGDMSKMYMRIEDIAGYSITGGVEQKLTIHRIKKAAIVVYTFSSKQELIRLIECRRKAHFISQGIEAPALSKGTHNHIVQDITGLDENKLTVPKNVGAGKVFLYGTIIGITIIALISMCS